MNTPHCNTDLQKRSKIIRQASAIALGGNLLLCSIKIIIGLASGSLAVLGDGVDSATDTGIAVMALIVSFIINKPSDKEHPWGHARAETIASFILTFIIMLAGIQLLIAAIQRLLSIYRGMNAPFPTKAAFAATIISILGKLLLSLNQYLAGKKTNSVMLLANARNMLNDIIISSSVLTGFVFCIILKAPYLDAVAALIVACLIIKSALNIFIELNVELMDGNTNKELYRQLFAAVQTIPEARNPHRARIRKMANLWDINLDIEVDGSLSVYEAHAIAEKTSLAIKNTIDNVYDVVIHVEPYNSNRTEESYGLSLNDIERI
ncbi:MAG: cation diffusion facilitator family transporter [Treponema sp.]